MKPFLLSAIFCLFQFQSGMCQNGPADSLYNQAKKFWFNNSDSVRYYLEQTLKVSRETNYLKGEANALKGLGFFSHSNAERLQHYVKALEIRQRLKDSVGIGVSLMDIGTVYDELGEGDKFNDYLSKSLQVRRKINDFGGIALCLIMFGHHEEKGGNYQQALTKYRESLIYRLKAGDINGIGFAHINIANAFVNLNQYDSALHYTRLAQNEFRQANNTLQQEWISWIIARCHLEKGFPDKALQELLGNKVVDDNYTLRVLGLLSNIYEAKSDFRQALVYQKKWIRKNESLQRESNQEKTLRLAADYEFKLKLEKGLRHDEMIKIEKRRQDNLQFLLIGIGLIVIFMLIISVRKRISDKALEIVSFVGCLLLFECLIVLIDPTLQIWSGNKPILLFLGNAVLALLVARIHSFLEKYFKAMVLPRHA